jgi:hypothetical protein
MFWNAVQVPIEDPRQIKWVPAFSRPVQCAFRQSLAVYIFTNNRDDFVPSDFGWKSACDFFDG